jgi:hypothetical protein
MKMKQIKIFFDFLGRAEELEKETNQWLKETNSFIENVRIEYKFHNQYVFLFYRI